MTKNVTTSQTPEPRPQLISRLARRRHWTRRPVFPWMRDQTGSRTIADQPIGFVRVWRRHLRARGFLERVRHSPAVVRTVRPQLAPLLPAKLSGLARAITRRIQGPQLARPLWHRAEAKISPEELVLASGLPPSSAPAGETPFTPSGLAQMRADRGMLAPGGTGFSTGQRIPPMPPKSGGAGFSVGQRIPPMPKRDKPVAGQPTLRPKPPVKKTKPPKPAPGQRIFSRVEEILPAQSPAIEESGETLEQAEETAPEISVSPEAGLPPAPAPGTDRAAGGDTPAASPTVSAGMAPVQRQTVETAAQPLSSETEPDSVSKPGGAAHDAGETGPETPPAKPIITGEEPLFPPASDVLPVAVQPEQPSTRRPTRQAGSEMDSEIVEPVPPAETETPRLATGDERAIAQRPESGSAEGLPAPPASDAPPPIEPGAVIAPGEEVPLPRKEEPAVEIGLSALDRELPEAAVKSGAPAETSSADETAAAGGEYQPPPADHPAKILETTRPKVQPLPPVPVDQVPESVVKPLVPKTTEATVGPPVLPQPGPPAEPAELEPVFGPVEEPLVVPDDLSPSATEPAAWPVPDVEQPRRPGEPVDLPPAARKPAAAGEQETAGAEPVEEGPGAVEPAAPPMPGVEKSQVPVGPADLPLAARKPTVVPDQPATAEPVDLPPSVPDDAPPMPDAEKPQVSVEPTGLPPAAGKPAVVPDQAAAAAGSIDTAAAGAGAGDRQDTIKPEPIPHFGDIPDLSRKRLAEPPLPPPGVAGAQGEPVIHQESGPLEESAALEPSALPSDLSRRLAARRPLTVSQSQPAVEGLQARLALAAGRIRQRQQPGVGPLRRRPQVSDRPSSGPLPLHSRATTAGAGAGQQGTFEAFRRRFGLPPETKPPQTSNMSLLAGLAQLGQPKYVPAGRPETPDPDSPGLSSEPGRAFSLDDITLGQPKINVVRRRPSTSRPTSEGTAMAVEPSRTAGGEIVAGRSPLELVRRANGSGKDSSDTAVASSGLISVPVPEISTSSDRGDTPDLGDLARDVYPLIKRLLALERERLG